MTIHLMWEKNTPHEWRIKRLMKDGRYPSLIKKDNRNMKRIFIENGRILSWEKYVPSLHSRNLYRINDHEIGTNLQINNIGTDFHYYPFKIDHYIVKDNNGIIWRREYNDFPLRTPMETDNPNVRPALKDMTYTDKINLSEIFGEGRVIEHEGNLYYQESNQVYKGDLKYYWYSLLQSSYGNLYGYNHNLRNVNQLDLNTVFSGDRSLDNTHQPFFVQGMILKDFKPNSYWYSQNRNNIRCKINNEQEWDQYKDNMRNIYQLMRDTFDNVTDIADNPNWVNPILEIKIPYQPNPVKVNTVSDILRFIPINQGNRSRYGRDIDITVNGKNSKEQKTNKWNNAYDIWNDQSNQKIQFNINHPIFSHLYTGDVDGRRIYKFFSAFNGNNNIIELNINAPLDLGDSMRDGSNSWIFMNVAGDNNTVLINVRAPIKLSLGGGTWRDFIVTNRNNNKVVVIIHEGGSIQMGTDGATTIFW